MIIGFLIYNIVILVFLIYNYLYDIIIYLQRWDKMRALGVCMDLEGRRTSPYNFISYLNETRNKSIKEVIDNV